MINKKTKQRNFLTVFCLSIGIIMTGCQNTVSAEKSETATKTLTIAYMPNEESTETLETLKKGFAEDVKKEIGLDVKELAVNDYNAAIEALRSGQADMAFMGALSYAVAYERAGAIPLAMVAKDGDKEKAIYYSVIMARADDDSIQSIKDVKGKVMFFSDPNSASANLIPSAEIMQAFPNENLTMEQLHTNGTFFKTTTYSGADLSSLLAVKNGDADLAAVADLAITRLSGNGEINEADYKVIHKSAPIVSSCMAIRKDYPEELREKLQQFLYDYQNKEYFKQVISNEDGRFVPTSVEDYQDIINLNKQLNPGQ